jgi:hypothetical protein
MSQAVTVRTGKVGKIGLRLAKKDHRFFGLANGKILTEVMTRMMSGGACMMRRAKAILSTSASMAPATAFYISFQTAFTRLDTRTGSAITRSPRSQNLAQLFRSRRRRRAVVSEKRSSLYFVRRTFSIPSKSPVFKICFADPTRTYLFKQPLNSR